MTITPDMFGRINDSVWNVVDQYLSIARKHSLEPVHMALAFCNQRPFVTSSIIGATSVDQLKVSLGAADLSLNDEVLDDIQRVYRQYPIPF